MATTAADAEADDAKKQVQDDAAVGSISHILRTLFRGLYEESEAPEDDARPKWLHYGKSADWFYPFFSLEGVADQIIKNDSIFVIESIGDSLAMTQEGMRNHMVAFTNVLNTRQVSRLATLNTNIILAFNNDEGQNRGFDGALSSCLKLMDQVDLQKIWFYPPPAEDFGEIIKNGGNLKEYQKNFN